MSIDSQGKSGLDTWQESIGPRDSNPLDAVENVATFKNWSFERAAEDELAVLAAGSWTDYSVSFSWVPDFDAIHVVCAFDMRVPQQRVLEAMRLLALINEQMFFGHFDLWVQDGSIMFRHAMPLAGAEEPTQAQVECLLSSALTSCERYYQAFQFVIWGGRDAKDALANVLFDTMGEA